MGKTVTINDLKAQVQAKIKELGKAKPFISGSFIRTFSAEIHPVVIEI